MTVINWSDDRTDQLKKLWNDGLSASQIAAELGHITRNAVIGKVRRLGLTGRLPGVSRAAAPRPRPAPAHARRATQIRKLVDRPIPEAIQEIVQPLAAADIPAAQRCGISQLTDRCCHWPVGDPGKPGFFFCGGAALADGPYCAHHARIAYQPNTRRTPDPMRPYQPARSAHGRF